MDRRERLEKQLADAEAAAPALAPLTSVRFEQMMKLRQQLNELQAHFTDAYPEVIRLRIEIAALEQRAADPVMSNPNVPLLDSRPRLKQAIADVDGELRALKAEELAHRRAIAS